MTDDIDQLRQSRDEAIAELNKAIETLGQLRSYVSDAGYETIESEKAWKARAQSAEASLAKLREAAKPFACECSECGRCEVMEWAPSRNKSCARYALRVLLETPNKGGEDGASDA